VKPGFEAGVVCACDIVALAGEGVLLKEIILSCGGKKIYDEIMVNGGLETRRLARREFERVPEYQQVKEAGK
jgi:hypothetical protein